MKFYEWLNELFFGMDSSIFRAVNEIGTKSPWVSNLARVVSFFGDKGIFFIALVVLLLVFRKTRKTGIILGMGMIIGSILVNTILKNAVARPRPYDEVEEFYMMWNSLGSFAKQKMHSFSFPSGHTSTATVIGVGLFLTQNKKYSWSFLFIPLLMGWSRIALFVHYPSDVLFGLISGVIAIVSAYFLSKLLFKWKFIENLTIGDKLF